MPLKPDLTKSFAEAMDKSPFDWNAFLAKETYTDEELQEARELAGDWVTCACGNQCHIIPRAKFDPKENTHMSAGEPLDRELKRLGIEFGDAIYRMEKADRRRGMAFENYKKIAIRILDDIEYRSAALIKLWGLTGS